MTTPSDEPLSSALLSFVSSTTYPPPELASATLGNETIAATLDGLQSLLRETETSIRGLSATSKTDIDPWISQARSLSDSVKASEAEAAAIVGGHKSQQTLEANVKDAQAKVRLLSREVDFVASLSGALDGLAVCVGLVDSATGLLADGDVRAALEKVGEAEGSLRGISDAARVKGVLERKVRSVREEGVGVVRSLWGEMISTPEGGRSVKIQKQAKGNFATILESRLMR
jgi:protein transport protein DSL1/ZW10